MAELNKSILGQVKGTLGELSFRQRNGKNIIATRPSSFTPGSDPDSIARRERFKFTIKLSKQLNNVSYIKSIWKLMKPAEMTGFNFLFKSNYNKVSADNFIASPIIFPISNFAASNPTGSFNSDFVEIGYDPIGNSTSIDLSIESELFAVSVLFLGEPSNNLLEKYKLFVVESESKIIDLENPITLRTSIPNNILEDYNNYQSKKIYSVLITKDSEGNLINFSNTSTF